MSKKETVELLVSDTNQHGKKMVLPLVGEVEVSSEGIIEVPTEHSEFLAEKCVGITFKDSKPKKLKVVKDEEEDEEEEDEDDNEEGDEDDEEEEGDGLDELELADLIKLAEEAKFPATEYKKFLKSAKLMIGYLRKKAEENSEK